MATERVYKEEEISTLLRGAYDQEKEPGDPAEAPYRYLTKWYLAKADKPDQRVALPETKDCKFQGNVVLHAMLEGRNPNTPAVPIQIPLSKENAWVVDFTPEKRGIWIEYGPGGAWYWLKEWDQSQDSLQQPIRAKLGLLSNILSILFEEHGGEEGHYFRDHVKLTPKQLHERLSCKDTKVFEVYKQNTEGEFLIFQEPFDYTLLTEHGGANFCKRHLARLLDDGSFVKTNFFKKLSKGKSNKKWSVEDYRASAEVSEQRSQCEPWGEQLAHAKPIRPNWNMEASLGQMDNAASGAPKVRNKPSFKKRAGSTGDKEGPPRKKRIVLDDSEDEEMEALNEDEATEEKVDLMKKESYSGLQMVAALTQLKEYLTPKPTSETGEWEDIIEKKFRIKDAQSAGEVVSLMRDSSDLTRECKLLIITAVLNVCLLEVKGKNEKILIKKIFNPKKGERVSGASIFDRWKREAKAMLDHLKDLDAKRKEEWFTHIVAYRILVQYIKFIAASGFFISTKEKLDILNEHTDLKWDQPDYLDDIDEFAKKYASAGRSQDLQRACFLTRRHLKKILTIKESVPGEGAEEPTAPEPQPASLEATAASASMVPVAPPLNDVPQQEYVSSAAESSTKPIVAVASKEKDDKAEDEAAETTRKHDEERRKKLKMLCANKTALVVQSAAQPASQVPTKPTQPGAPPVSPAADSTESSPASVEPLATNWVTKPCRIVARPEDWMSVTGKEPFFLNRKIPSPSPDDATWPQENHAGRSQRARPETSRPSREHYDNIRGEGQVLPEKSGEARTRYPRNTDSHRSSRLDRNSIRREQDYRPTSRRSGSFERGNSRLRQEHTLAPRRDRGTERGDSRPHDYPRRHENEFQHGDRIRFPSQGHITDSGQDRRFDDEQRRPPAYASVNEAKDTVKGKNMNQLSWESAVQQPLQQGAPLPHRGHHPVELPSDDDISSRGRGRGRTLPAWMTQRRANESVSGGGTAAGSHAALPETNGRPQGCPPPSGLREGGAEAGRGRGRGRAKTLPAWMTHK